MKGGEVTTKNNLIITVIVALLVGAGGFFAGMKFGQSQGTPATGQTARGQFMRNGNSQGQFRGNRPVTGDIISAGAKSITVKLADGSTKLVLISDSTQINKADSATAADLITGATVAVFGVTNSDGSVTAQNIQLNPTIRMGDRAPSPTP